MSAFPFAVDPATEEIWYFRRYPESDKIDRVRGIDWNGDGVDELIVERHDEYPASPELLMVNGSRDSFRGVKLKTIEVAHVDDINADGRDDILSERAKFPVPYTATGNFDSPFAPYFPSSTVVKTDWDNRWASPYPYFDINGDGRKDAVARDCEFTNDGAQDTVRAGALVYMVDLQRAAIEPSKLINVPAPFSLCTPARKLHVPFWQYDYNGDGVNDVIFPDPDLNFFAISPTTGEQLSFRREFLTLDLRPSTVPPGVAGFWNPLRADMNWRTWHERLRIIDLNGDGVDDVLELVQPDEPAPVKAIRGHLNTRGGRLVSVYPYERGQSDFVWTEAKFSRSFVYDVNNDGRADLLSPEPGDAEFPQRYVVHASVSPDAFLVG